MKRGFATIAALAALVTALLVCGGCGGGHSSGDSIPTAQAVFSLNLPADLARGSMALAPNGDLYTATRDTATNTVLVERFPNDGTGTPLSIGSAAVSGNSNTFSIAFCAGLNQIYLIQQNHVVVLSPEGQTGGQSLRTFVLENPSDTSSTDILTVAADSRGYLYAARDYGVDKYDPNGSFLATLPASYSVYSTPVVDSADRLYLSTRSHSVVRYAPDGAPLSDLTLEGPAEPLAILLFVSPSGDIYAIDIHSVIRRWDSAGKLVGSAYFPSAPVAIDGQNRIYAANGTVYRPL